MLDLIYVGNYPPQTGGAAISCHQLLTRLSGLECRCRVLASITAEAEAETRAFDASQSQLEFLRFFVPFYFNRPYEGPPAEWETASRDGVVAGLEKMIDESRPDALLLREGWIPYANEVAARHGIPTIALVRGNPTSAIIRGVYPAELAQDFVQELQRVSRLVTVGRHFLPRLAELGIHHAECIPNLVDLRLFAPQDPDRGLASRYGIEPRDIVVLNAGHMTALKRPVDLVTSAAQALSVNPNLLYLFVGEGDRRREMETLSEQLGVRDRMRFEGFVDYGLMPAYMNLASLVVVASESEGLARMYIEAQACAKTLVCSDIPAAREVIVHGQTGLLFRKGDAADLAEKILLAAGDAVLRTEIGRKALAQVQAHGIDAVAREYVRLVERVIAEPTRVRR